MVQPADLKEAERLARYRHGWLVRMVQEREAWLMLYCALCATAVNLVGREHVPWSTVGIVYAAAAGLFLVRYFFADLWLRRRAKKLSRTPLNLRIDPVGLYFHMPDGSLRIRRWPDFLEARAGDRVLLLFYKPKKAWYRRRKSFIVPLAALDSAQKTAVLETLPDRLRSKSIQEAIASWRLS